MGSVGPEWWLLSDPEACYSPLPLRTSISKVTSWSIVADGVVVRSQRKGGHPLFKIHFRSAIQDLLCQNLVTWPHLTCIVLFQLGISVPNQRKSLSLTEEKIVGAATSGRRHHHLTSSFVPHSAIILIGRYFSLWSLSQVISIYSSRVPLTCYSSINLSVQTLLESHDVRLHCSLLLFP